MHARKIKNGDLVEYIGPLSAMSKRPRFGIVFHVKKLVRGDEIGVYFGNRVIYIHSKYLEKR